MRRITNGKGWPRLRLPSPLFGPTAGTCYALLSLLEYTLGTRPTSVPGPLASASFAAASCKKDSPLPNVLKASILNRLTQAV